MCKLTTALMQRYLASAVCRLGIKPKGFACTSSPVSNTILHYAQSCYQALRQRVQVPETPGDLLNCPATCGFQLRLHLRWFRVVLPRCVLVMDVPLESLPIPAGGWWRVNGYVAAASGHQLDGPHSGCVIRCLELRKKLIRNETSDRMMQIVKTGFVSS